MTQEEKQLLLIDLCARLPYNTIVRINNGKYFEDIELKPYIVNGIGMFKPMPYLRLLSSMTDEEKNELDLIIDKCNKKVFTCPKEERRYNFFDMEQVHFYLSHHFDINELILKNLAIEAPEGMYNK